MMKDMVGAREKDRMVKLIALDVGIIVFAAVIVIGSSFSRPYIDVEWENLKAKMRYEASRLEAEFSRCFENLTADNLAGLTDNEIYSLLVNLMPRGSLALLSENIYSVVINQVSIETVENGRVAKAIMQYSIWHESRPEYELRGWLENENVAVLAVK